MASYRQPPRQGARILVTPPHPVKPCSCPNKAKCVDIDAEPARRQGDKPMKKGPDGPAPFSFTIATSGDLLAGRLLEGRDLLALLRLEHAVALGGDLPPTRHDAAGAGRDEPADDDVLLEAGEHIDPAGD